TVKAGNRIWNATTHANCILESSNASMRDPRQKSGNSLAGRRGTGSNGMRRACDVFHIIEAGCAASLDMTQAGRHSGLFSRPGKGWRCYLLPLRVVPASEEPDAVPVLKRARAVFMLRLNSGLFRSAHCFSSKDWASLTLSL